ncbi:FtsQ-type POTRA domain-containing protein [bacterium]|nr:FtsQ-type POTRA domain-containing protein [bacterium]
MKSIKKQKIRVRNKFKKLRKEKIKEISKHSLNLISASLIGGIIIFKLYHFLFLSSFFELKKVEIKGNEMLSESEIRKSLKLRKKENIFLVTKENIKEYLNGVPTVETVIMKRKIPGTLCLEIIERTPVGYCKINGQLKGIDKAGILFDCKDLKKEIPFIIGLISGKEEEKKKLAIDFLQLVKNESKCPIGREIVKVVPKDFCKIIFLLRDGTKVFFGKVPSPDINLKLTYLEKVLLDLKNKNKKIDYVDMQYFTSDIGKVIVKLSKT